MAKQKVDPDALASKMFVATMLGAILYITVVFIFVISGNDKLLEEGQSGQTAAHATQGH
jgi:hypothetical protein